MLVYLNRVKNEVTIFVAQEVLKKQQNICQKTIKFKGLMLISC